LQAPAPFIGGLLAGVNRKSGSGPGALVGLMSGFAAIFIIRSGPFDYLVDPFSSNLLHLRTPVEPPIMVQLYGLQGFALHQVTLMSLPLVYFVFSVLGGFFGATLWKPVPDVAMPTLINREGAASVGLKTNINMPKQEPQKSALISGPIGWVQVIAGIGIAIFGGSFAARPVREFVLNITEGMFAIKNQEQDAFTIMEVFAFSLLLGGTVSGATRANGLKQGLIVGVGAGLGMVPFLAGTETAKYTPFIVLSALFLAPLGGWFGTTLLPPPPPPRLAPPPD
jgi:hypothetical protein